MALDACDTGSGIRRPRVAYHQFKACAQFLAFGKQGLVIPKATRPRSLTRGALVAAAVPPASDLGDHLSDALVGDWALIADHLRQAPVVSPCLAGASPMGSPDRTPPRVTAANPAAG